MSTLSCPICSETCSSVKLLKKHIENRHKFEWKLPFRCGQESCAASFDNTSSLWRHIRNKHQKEVEISSGSMKRSHSPDVPTSDFSCDDPDPENTNPSTSNDFSFTQEVEPTMEELRNSIETVASNFVAALRAKSDVTMTTLLLALDHCNSVVEKTTAYLAKRTLDYLNDKGVEIDLTELVHEFEDVSRPMEFLSTEAKQEQYFKQCKGFVAPVSHTFGESHWVLQRRRDEIFHHAVHDTWMYVPIEETLRVTLSIPEVYELIKSQKPRNDGLITEFVDGLSFKSHPLYKDHPEVIFMALELYYDDLEIANPLGSKTKTHKQGVFYYRIKNLPSHYGSCSRNIHLVALARTIHLKSQNGYEVVLKKIAADIHKLESHGFELELSNGQKKLVRSSIVVCNGDNLARHTIFGFFEGFTAIKFCETCMVSRPEEQTKFCERDFDLRTKDMVDSQVKLILKDISKRKLYGIKGRCALHDTMYFHLTMNKTGDLMHDLLEGVGVTELQLVLDNLINIKKYFSLDDLNFRIQSFPYGQTDIKNKPSSISAVKSTTQGKTLNQKAFQMWCLLRLLPFIVGHLVRESDPYWQFYLKLRVLMDMLFAQKWTGGMATRFSELYGEHLTDFRLLFPEVHLSCKHHFLLHYPTFVVHTGPPYKMMVAAMEMKMNHIKRKAHIMCNFMNAPYTMAKAHQYFAYFNHCSGKMYSDVVTVDRSESLAVISLPNYLQIVESLSVNANSDISVGMKVNIFGQMYKKDMVLSLFLDRATHLPVFGKLFCTMSKNFCSGIDGIYVLVELYKTLLFENHMHCYSVQLTDQFKLLKFTELIDYHPLDSYRGKNIDDFYICPRYVLF